jgi:glutamyl-tRNA reductase
MLTYQPIIISNFFVAGINHQKTDAATRGQFAINNEQYEDILKLAPLYCVDALFILSTCNRTEIYGFAESPAQLIDLLCTQTKGDREAFAKIAYIHNGGQAVAHLFNVGAGLDSQLLGDYEIVGQLKQAFKFSKERNFVNCFLERLLNNVLQASKSIKNDTALSCGTVSVAFAAMQYIKQNIEITPDIKILMIGTGKIGRNTCKNIVDHLGTTNITLINRSVEKAAELATELNLRYAPVTELGQHIEQADIILTATNSCEPTILKQHLGQNKQKLIIDLSVPYNTEPGVSELPHITLINVDALSVIKDQTIQQRMAEVPKAKEIIKQQMAEFMEWYLMRKNAPAIGAVKAKLNKLYIQNQLLVNGNIILTANPKQKIQQVLNAMAFKMRGQNIVGCYYIEAINEFMDGRPS